MDYTCKGILHTPNHPDIEVDIMEDIDDINDEPEFYRYKVRFPGTDITCTPWKKSVTRLWEDKNNE